MIRSAVFTRLTLLPKPVLDGVPDPLMGRNDSFVVVRPTEKHCESLLPCTHQRDCCSRLHCSLDWPVSH